MAGKMSVSFLDVGHGDSIVIIYPDQITATIIDTPNSKITYDYILDNGIHYIDWVFISHGDIDHYKGIFSLMNNLIHNGIRISNIGYIRHDKKIRKERDYDRLRRQFVVFEDLYDITTIEPYAKGNSYVEYMGMEIESLFPDSPADVDSAGDNSNDSSIVLLIEYQNYKILLPGDLQAKGWFRLLKKCKKRGMTLNANLLKLPHHGSWFNGGKDRVSLKDVIYEINASVGVISSGYHKKFSFPSRLTVKTLKEASYRVMCTGCSKTCTNGLSDFVLPNEIKHASNNPCAGIIKVEIEDNNVIINPEPGIHNNLIKQLAQPLCQ
jgi:competence protein ComEC